MMIVSTLFALTFLSQAQTSEQTARNTAIAVRQSLRTSASQNLALYDAGATIYNVFYGDLTYNIRFSDRSTVMVDGNSGKVTFISCEGDRYEPYSGSGVPISTAFSNVQAAYAALGYTDPLALDVGELVNDDPGVGAVRLDCAPMRNGIPVTREYSVLAFVGPTSGGVRFLDAEPLPNINTAMMPVLTVAQARPLLLGYLFSKTNVSSVIETDYEVALRWGKAPLEDEVNEDTYIPTGDLATLRATNTALLMYDVRYMDTNYGYGKTGEAIYRVIMDARTGQVVGMDGPVIAMFGGDSDKRRTVNWGWGDGPLTLYFGKQTASARGDVEPVKTDRAPRGVHVMLTRGRLNVRASYDRDANLLWIRGKSGPLAGRPSKAVEAALRKLVPGH